MRALQARSLLAVGLLGSLTIVLATTPVHAQGVPGIEPNKCLAGKNKCVSKKIAGLMKCRAKCQKNAGKCGVVQDACEQKVMDKFDGGTNPAKGCFAKLEAKDDPAKPDSVCTTTGDTASMEAVVDATVGDLMATLEGNPPSVCGNGVLEGSEDCDFGDLDGETCATQGFFGTGLACTPGSCTFDTSACAPSRFEDTGLTVLDHQTGLEWEKKRCPDNYAFTGTYSSSLPSTGTFMGTINAIGTTFTGSAVDSAFGPINDLSGTVTGTSFSGSMFGGAITMSGSIDCVTGAVTATFGGAVTGTGSGTGTGSVDDDYTWTAASIGPNGDAFTTFLAQMNAPFGPGAADPNGPTDTGCYAGHCDWRLAVIEELTTIVDCGFGPPCIDPIFGPATSGLYWSSTSVLGLPTNAWAVSFADGSVTIIDKINPLYVRAVRGGS